MTNAFMQMIQQHVYARSPETKVYGEASADAAVVGIITAGHWMGVTERQGPWLKIMSTHVEGWVLQADVEERPPFQLHIEWNPGKPAEYLNLAS